MTRKPLPRSLYAETARPAVATPPLDGDRRVDVCVIGGGFTGLSAALHLAQQGVDVAVLEAHEPGWGASGRNGGQVNPGLKHDPDRGGGGFRCRSRPPHGGVVGRCAECRVPADRAASDRMRCAAIRYAACGFRCAGCCGDPRVGGAVDTPRRTGGVAGERCGARGHRHRPLRLRHAGPARRSGESAGLCARSGTGCDAGGRGGAWRDAGVGSEAQRHLGCAHADRHGACRQARAGNQRLHRRCVAGTAPQRRAGVQRDRGERTVAAGAHASRCCTRWGGSRSTTGSIAPTAC